MGTLTTVTVQGEIDYPSGDDFSDASIRFELTKTDFDTSDSITIPTAPWSIALDSDGTFSDGLWPNDRGSSASRYLVTLSYFSNEKYVEAELGYISIPEAGAPHDLDDLLAAGEPTPDAVYVGIITQAEYDAAIAAVADAEAEQAAAEAAQAAAEAAAATVTAEFDTVSAMKAATNITVGDYVRTLGYYAPGDGGGNTYEIVAAATGTDDGGSYIDLTGISGQAKGLFGGVAHAAAFGAAGDYDPVADTGTDDSTAIAAIYDADVTVDLGDRDYKITTTAARDKHMAGDTIGSGAVYYDDGSTVQKLEKGPHFTSAANFFYAVENGLTYPEGSDVDVTGQTYVKDDDETFIPGLSGWRYPWQKQKHLLSADWQPRPDSVSAGEEARFQGVLDSIAGRHPDLTYAHVLGDLVHEGSQDTTGADPDYGFPELLADWRTRLPIPLHNAFLMPGNHDRDGTGSGNFKEAWSMQTYRSQIGPEYYYTVQGNLLNIYMGDMGGSTAGAITDAVVAWFREVCFANKDKNIIVNLHHPLSGTYQSKTEAIDADAVQANSSRITDILDDVAADADNIAAVFFGHVGSQYQFNRETHHGTEHIQIGMHIPSNVNNSRDDLYYVMELVHGDSSFDIVQWNATDDTEGSTETVNWKYPLQLGPEVERHVDGPRIYPLRVAIPLDEYVEDTGGGTYAVPEGTKVPMGYFQFEDRANLANADHVEATFNFGWGVVNTGGDFDGTASQPAHEDAAEIALARLNGRGSGSAPTLSWVFRAMEDGTLVDHFVSDERGLHAGHDGTNTSNPGSNGGTEGATLNSQGYISAHRDSGVTGYFGRNGNGNYHNFYDAGTYNGGIENSSGTLQFNQSSDYRIKTLIDAPEERNSVDEIRALAGRLKWYTRDGYTTPELGWLAHEMQAVAPYAVSGEKDAIDENGDPILQGRRDMTIIPRLVGALGDALDRIEQLEEKLSD